MNYKPIGDSGISLPPVIFGTSCLGNLYQELPLKTKYQILSEIDELSPGPFVLDSAGKYGAGLALEVIGQGITDLKLCKERVIISNKLGWLRTPLTAPEPTFEPGAWMGLKYDAVQKISYEGILECWEQGCGLLKREPQIVSVHDPDEYLARAGSPQEKNKLFSDITGAYRGLAELKKTGRTAAVGVGAKDWQVIRDIAECVDLDWVMLAISFTVYTHPKELMDFLDGLQKRNIGVINSAVFHAGFLTGGRYFNYQVIHPDAPDHKHYLNWRNRFFTLCKRYDVLPANACVQFGISHPAVISIALNTSKPERVVENMQSVSVEIPDEFWTAMKNEGLIDRDYPYLG